MGRAIKLFIMIFYFSGTGNSLWVARQLQESLQEPLYKLVDVLSSDQVYALGDEERLGFVFPVYSWGPPEVVLEMISRLRLSRKPSFLYFVCTCGDDAGKTAEVFCKAVERRGWTCQAGYSVFMPNTYVCLPGFDVDAPEVESRKREEAWGRVREIQVKIAGRESGFDCHEGSMPFLKTYVVRPLFCRFLMSARWFHASDACISCGICEKVCPMNNIRVDRKPVWGKRCTQCLACYHFCPMHAVAYGSQTLNKGQYYFERKVMPVRWLLSGSLWNQAIWKKSPVR